ncbi:MAG: sigma-70 family RNA polymerase sigma factor [Deltaproteobacteria bacterium]|nr:sigma-70 family RNA polymerase sigma factor [Deltaproteobacteria bacterium]MBK8717867.1 sigma-70 family RNA polymerase sigma factor [Deltaproteobacteria bacterium]MBP7287772.1 sigma-70 family RNA polymerase sigma factor [Nannocystaceae bacterium]
MAIAITNLRAPELVGTVDASTTGPREDAALVRAAAEGDRPAFAELVRRHQGKVRGLLLRLCGDRTLADDLAQEVFLRAYRGLCGFEGRASFGTWLYRISYNAYLNHATRAKTFAVLPLGYDSAAVAPEDAHSAPRADLRRDLAAAVAELPQRYRGVVVLYYLQDLSYPEIAEILELPLGTVKTHLHRAKRLLRGKLHGWDARLDDGDDDVGEDEP